jgi:hypothetical protein
MLPHTAESSHFRQGASHQLFSASARDDDFLALLLIEYT